MGIKHYKEKLSDFVDLQLNNDERQLVGEHLLVCDECRREHDAIRFGSTLAGKLERADAPHSVWRSIESELDGTAPHITIIPDARPFGFKKVAGFAMAVLVVGLFSGLVYRGLFMGDGLPVAKNEQSGSPANQRSLPETVVQPTVPENVNANFDVQPAAAAANANTPQTGPEIASTGSTEYWQVDTLAGSPQIDAGPGAGKLAVGSYLVTDARSRARVEVADIGSVEIAPNSRVKLVGTNKEQHRLSLERGHLHAKIAAPPRLFIVDTPSAVAVDLGCEYTLEVDNAGNNKLHVTSGFVALERGGRESIVPAGAMCLTRKGKGIGTPFSAETTTEFRAALERFDFAGGGSSAVRTMLEKRNFYDIVTLWHLLSRVSGDDREKVFDALATYVNVPEGVTRDGVLKLNKSMLETWRQEVERVWFE